jgi:hypothetical protein
VSGVSHKTYTSGSPSWMETLLTKRPGWMQELCVYVCAFLSHRNNGMGLRAGPSPEARQRAGSPHKISILACQPARQTNICPLRCCKPDCYTRAISQQKHAVREYELCGVCPAGIAIDKHENGSRYRANKRVGCRGRRRGMPKQIRRGGFLIHDSHESENERNRECVRERARERETRETGENAGKRSLDKRTHAPTHAHSHTHACTFGALVHPYVQYTHPGQQRSVGVRPPALFRRSFQRPSPLFFFAPRCHIGPMSALP